jgi:hypothetical protein
MRCVKYPVTGRDRCRVHGGRSRPGGPSHHTYRHGRYSKILPKDLKSRYEQALLDPELTSSKEEIAVLVALMPDAFANIGQQDDPRAALKLEECVRRIASEFARAADLITKGEKLTG